MPPEAVRTQPSSFPGRLFVVEGIDGSGKSTQLHLLREWLRSEGYITYFSEWNSSELVKSTTKRGKEARLLTPLTFSLVHATDFAERIEHFIVPIMKAGAVALADRYAYTAFARDVARGVDRDWVRRLYRFASCPTLAFYFRVPLQTALERIQKGPRAVLSYYEAGLDLGLSNKPEESFALFQQRLQECYEEMVEEFGFRVIDATRSVEEQQAELRALIRPHLKGLRRLPRH